MGQYLYIISTCFLQGKTSHQENSESNISIIYLHKTTVQSFSCCRAYSFLWREMVFQRLVSLHGGLFGLWACHCRSSRPAAFWVEEPRSVQTLHDWGNTSSSSIWYETDWIERFGVSGRQDLRNCVGVYSFSHNCHGSIWKWKMAILERELLLEGPIFQLPWSWEKRVWFGRKFDICYLLWSSHVWIVTTASRQPRVFQDVPI